MMNFLIDSNWFLIIILNNNKFKKIIALLKEIDLFLATYKIELEEKKRQINKIIIILFFKKIKNLNHN
jgi:hypothetical protein